MTSQFESAVIAAGWRINPKYKKWMHRDSSASYPASSPNACRYICEDHDINVLSGDKLIANQTI